MPEGISLELPDLPSIAALPFANISGDPEQEYFSDGITEDIITDLSKISNLFVIARNSSFQYKGQHVDVRKVGEELGVRFVLEGSVRKAGNRVRITAQLIEAATGNHLWAERYDRELEDVFAVQDDITAEIVTALDVKLVKGEQARIRRKSLRNPQARDLFYRGIESFNTMSKEGMVECRKFNEEVIRLEPDSPTGYTGMAQANFYDAFRGWSDDPAQSRKNAMECAQKAIDLDELNAWAHALMGCLLLIDGKHSQALATSERAIALAPNYADVVAWSGWTFLFSCLFEEGIFMTRRAIRLCPIAPAWYLMVLAAGLQQTGQYEEAIALCSHAITREPDYATPYFILAVSCSALGRHDEARKAAEDFRRVSPHTPKLQEFARRYPFKDPAENEKQIEILHKAGLE
jgi:adenylate cyclase